MTAPYEPLGREEGLTLGELRNQIDFDDEGFKQFCRGHDLIAKLDGKEMSDYSTAHKAWLWGHYKGLIGDDPHAPIPELHEVCVSTPFGVEVLHTSTLRECNGYIFKEQPYQRLRMFTRKKQR